MDWLNSISTLLAQTVDASTPTSVVTAIVVAFGSVVGLVVWIVRRLFDVTLPEQQKLFQHELTTTRDFFAEQIKTERIFFSQMLERIIADTKSAHADVLARLEKQNETLTGCLNAVQENQTGIRETIRISEEHFEHWQAVAMEWRDLTAAERRKMRQRGSDIEKQKPPGPGGVTA